MVNEGQASDAATVSPGYQRESFGQSEPLTVRIKGLLHQYPQGVGILKELLQNADDAGARHVVFTVDWRDRQEEILGEDALPDSRLRKLRGPALLAWNDSAFTEDDFTHIKRIGDSAKREDVTRTGRFGIGFNSVYHVTDCPGFLSRDRLCFFDPHDHFVSRPGEHGCSFSFTPGVANNLWDRHPLLGDLYRAGDPEGDLTFDANGYKATVFRLPFRDATRAPHSEIRPNQPFTRADMEDIVRRFVGVGAEMLLFLKNVQSIKIQEVGADGPEDAAARPLVHVRTENPDEVEAARSALREELAMGLPALRAVCQNAPHRLRVESYRHAITVTYFDQEEGRGSLRATETLWRVVSGFQVDRGGEMVRLMQELAALPNGGVKAVPWGGVAALVSRWESPTADGEMVRTEVTPKGGVDGRVYCFLPLDAPTGLPVHINGFFDLDAARTGLTVEGNTTGADRKRGEWNRALTRHTVAPLYARLLEDLRGDMVAEDGDGVTRFYAHFPTKTPMIAVLEELRSAAREHLAAHSILQVQSSEGSARWAKPGDTRLLPGKHSDLREPLTEMGYLLPIPALPGFIQEYFSVGGITVKSVRNALVQNGRDVNGIPLADAPYSVLTRREWVLALLRFCLSEPGSIVSGLPLALRADGLLATFAESSLSATTDPSGRIWYPDPEVRAIFPTRPEWFLDPTVLEAVPEIDSATAGLPRLTSEQVAQNLHRVVVEAENPPDGAWDNWKPDGAEPPNATWLASVYRYFTGKALSQSAQSVLKAYRIVPSGDGELYSPGNAKTPLRAGDLRAELWGLLTRCGIRFVEGPLPLMDAIGAFAQQHKGFLWDATPEDVLDSLGVAFADGELPELTEEDAAHLLDFLCRLDLDTLTDERRAILKRLPLYRVIGEEVQVTLENTEGLYLPGQYDPPKCAAGSVRLLDTGKDDRWRPLLTALGLKPLNRVRLLTQALLPGYEKMTEADQYETLCWVRDNLTAAESEGDGNALRSQVRETKLVRGETGGLHAVRYVYNPQALLVRDLLGDTVAYPDFSRTYARDADRWRRFFSDLRWHNKPRAQDIARHISGLRKRAKLEGVATVADDCRRVFDFLRERWDDYGAVEITTSGGDRRSLGELLSQWAWLPAVSDPSTLRRYFAARTPENRLYRPCELAFTQQAHSVASQLCLFSTQMPSNEMQVALGFHPLASPKLWDLVIKHFAVLIGGTPPAPDTPDYRPFTDGLLSVYRHINQYQSSLPDLKARLTSPFAERPCLWDGSTLHIPAKTFQRGGECFGRWRTTLSPEETSVAEAYRLLGQRDAPGREDVLEVLDELRLAAGDGPLTEDDCRVARESLRYLWSRVRPLCEANPTTCAEVREMLRSRLLLLTDEGRMELWRETLIPDAPWRERYLDPTVVHLLDAGVPTELAVFVGCTSLAYDVREQPERLPERGGDATMRQWAAKFQHTCRSPEFWDGLRRLQRHDREASTLPPAAAKTLARLEVIPVESLRVRLVLERDGREYVIAQGVEAQAWYDHDSDRLYLRRASDSRDLELPLAEQLNAHALEGSLKDLALFCRLLSTPAERISDMLTSARVARLYEDSVDVPPAADAPKLRAIFGDQAESDEQEEAMTTAEADRSDTLIRADETDEAESGNERETGGEVEDQEATTTARLMAESPQDQASEPLQTSVAPHTTPLPSSDNTQGSLPSGPGTSPRRPSPETGTGPRDDEAGEKHRAPGIPMGERGETERKAGADNGAPVTENLPSSPAAPPKESSVETPTSAPLPSSHGNYSGSTRALTPARPVDVAALQERFPNAQVAPQGQSSGEGRDAHVPAPSPDLDDTLNESSSSSGKGSGTGRKRRGYTGPLAAQNEGIVLLRSVSFSDGALPLDSPPPAALFPPGEATLGTAESGGKPWYALELQGEDGPRLHLAVDYQKEVAFFPLATEQGQIIAWLRDNLLEPGCYLTLDRLENGGYRLGYRDEPHTLDRVPLLQSDPETGRPVVVFLDGLKVPCPVNRRIYHADRRFVDDEAIAALYRLTQSAPDLVSALCILLEGCDGPISLEDLYTLNDAVRPVSWAYFEQVVMSNCGDGLPFAGDANGLTLRPASEVHRVNTPQQYRPQSSRGDERESTLAAVEMGLRGRVLNPWPVTMSQEETLQAILDILNNALRS